MAGYNWKGVATGSLVLYRRNDASVVTKWLSSFLLFSYFIQAAVHDKDHIHQVHSNYML